MAPRIIEAFRKAEAIHPTNAGVTYRMSPFGIAYNTDLIKEEEGKQLTWEDCTATSTGNIYPVRTLELSIRPSLPGLRHRNQTTRSQSAPALFSRQSPYPHAL